MGKTTRYFDKEDEKSESDSIIKKQELKDEINISDPICKFGNVITYNTNLNRKLKPRREKRVNERPVKKKFQSNPNPKYPGRAPINKALLLKHGRGEGVNENGVKLNVNKLKLKQKEKAIQFSTEQAAHTEILLTEDTGLLEADAGETTTQFRQEQIAANVDITAAAKHFELHLKDFGPYRMNYTRNGRHLLLGGKMGHIAALDWITKKLHCEFNVMESIHDVCWLHVETMFAVAQKKWVYIYDNQGIELHCLKKLNKISRMQFLPYHFLLAAASEEGYLSWLDISIGQLVSQYNSKLGRLSLLCQNPQNAVLCTGHAKGIVSMWSPNVRDPLAKILCHKTAMTALHVDSSGLYLATAASDRSLKIWDIRKLEGPLQSYHLRTSVQDLNFSHKGVLAVAMGNVIEVYKNCCSTASYKADLRHVLNSTVGNMQFCPYEDVLGVASSKGFSSLLVPGAGEAHFDALEANPYQTKSQRREAEVKALLEKIQPEFITLNPNIIAEIDVPTLQDKIEAKKKLLYLKPPKIDFTTRKLKKHAGSVQLAKSKKIVQEVAKKEFLRNKKLITLQEEQQTTDNRKQIKNDIFHRFLPKNVNKKN